ncbi:histidine phosphotransferase ChpT [Shimia gijangensis]|uniref:Histidine phosphotransferase ChpT n=1 Tax=Shimia gijangensis TaxID=1470563 RepID=A0A1M6S7G0_9RHOB|nr:histidine phosphotransferase family protein [Shimia gijangensis]SHK40620.1 histidine phosphotransferase ChpT [Shimia gijangensis]
MTQNNMDFSALVGSRICHDLISPVGAIGNGVELIGMGGSSGPEIELIADSVGNANARIRFFRIAFGLAGTEQMVGVNEVRTTLNDLSAGGRVSYAWDVMRDVPRPELRAGFLALMCLESALPLGGFITITENANRWQFTAQGRKINFEDNLWADLTRANRTVEVTPGRVQFGLLPQIVDDLGRELGVRREAEQLTLSF